MLKSVCYQILYTKLHVIQIKLNLLFKELGDVKRRFMILQQIFKKKFSKFFTIALGSDGKVNFFLSSKQDIFVGRMGSLFEQNKYV